MEMVVFEECWEVTIVDLNVSCGSGCKLASLVGEDVWMVWLTYPFPDCRVLQSFLYKQLEICEKGL